MSRFNANKQIKTTPLIKKQNAHGEGRSYVARERSESLRDFSNSGIVHKLTTN